VKAGNETAEATDWGADPAARPAMAKKPAVDEHPEKAVLAEAERLKVEGWVLLQEVLIAMKERPDAPETLKQLYLQLESATALLSKSRDTFLSVKLKVSDPASIDETVAIIGRVLDIAARHTESIKSRLKPTVSEVREQKP
jgi:hypothetical protein